MEEPSDSQKNRRPPTRDSCVGLRRRASFGETRIEGTMQRSWFALAAAKLALGTLCVAQPPSAPTPAQRAVVASQVQQAGIETDTSAAVMAALPASRVFNH